MPEPGDPGLLLSALRACPPHEDWRSFVSLLEFERQPGSSADRLVNWLSHGLRHDSPDRLQVWLQLTRRAAALPSAEVHGVRARLDVAWTAPDRLQEDVLGTLADLAELAEARECGLLPWVSETVLWLLDRSRPPRWDPSFATALLAAAQGRSVPELASALVDHAATMPRITTRLELDIAAAIRLTAWLT
jgi:hypothetical protein